MATFPGGIKSFTTKVDNSTVIVAEHVNTLQDEVVALQEKVGIDSSAEVLSIDYKLKNTTAGHDHDGSDSKKVITTNLDVTGLTASQLLRANSGGTALESSGKVAPTGTIVGTSDTQTLTNKTLTTPIIASISNTGTLTLPTSTDTVVGRATTDTLTNKTLTSPVINTQITGTAIVDEDTMTSDSAVKVPTQQSVKAYVDSRATATQTLTNKTLTKPTVNGSTGAFTSDSDAATITFDMAASNMHTVTLGGNRTLAVSNVSTGQCFVIRLTQDGTGSRTVTWWSTIKWANGGTAPTLTTTATKTDVFGFICTGTNAYDGFVVGQNL